MQAIAWGAMNTTIAASFPKVRHISTEEVLNLASSPTAPPATRRLRESLFRLIREAVCASCSTGWRWLRCLRVPVGILEPPNRMHSAEPGLGI